MARMVMTAERLNPEKTSCGVRISATPSAITVRRATRSARNRSLKNKTSFNEDFQDFITRYAWGDLWQRGHFDDRTRRVLVIGSMIALGRFTAPK